MATADSTVKTASNFAGSWSSVKWGGGGYVTGLIYHPINTSLLYARTDVGGAYRWNPTMSTWIPLTDGLGFGVTESRYHGVESLALDPNNDQLVYITTGDTTYWGNNGRMYISSDYGNTWSWYNLPFPIGGNDNGRAIGERLAVDPNSSSILFYGSRTAGLWKSTDSGHTWSQVTGLSFATITGTPIGIEQVIFDSSIKSSSQPTWIIWTSIAPDYVNSASLTSTLYKSVNGGTTWIPVSVPTAVSGYYIPHIVRTSDGMFYVVFNQNAGQGALGPGYLYQFNTSNNAWTLLSSSIPKTTGGYGGLSVFGLGSNARIALGVTGTWGDNPNQVTQLSDDGGSTWREIEANMMHTGTIGNNYSGWNEDTVIDPADRNHIMHIYGGGIWETRNASSITPTWDLKVNNLEQTVTLSVITSPAGASYKLINCAGDIGTWVITDLAIKPTMGPTTNWSNGNSADMAWSDPLYIVGAGVASWSGEGGFGFWSGDGGNTWANFSSLPGGAQANTDNTGNIVVTSRNRVVWAPPNTVPSYTIDNGVSWISTNLPPLAVVGQGWSRGYRLAADRQNINKVYAYDSGGASWGTAGMVYISIDGGHTFTLSQGSLSANLTPNDWANTSMVVNPNAEGDIWLTDGNTVYHSVDSGATWMKLNGFATVNGAPGASVLALGKAGNGNLYSAAIYVVGTMNGVWGVYCSDNAGASWSRFNDDAHQFGGIHHIAADWNIYGRIYVSGEGRGLIYSN